MSNKDAIMNSFVENKKRLIGGDERFTPNSPKEKYHLILSYYGLDKKFRRIAINKRTAQRLETVIT